MSVSQSETSPLRISKEDTLPPTIKKTQLKNAKLSWPKSLSLTIQTKSELDIHQFLTATPPTLPVNSTKLSPKLIDVRVKFLKKDQNSSNPEMLPWFNAYHPNQCALKTSRITP